MVEPILDFERQVLPMGILVVDMNTYGIIIAVTISLGLE